MNRPQCYKKFFYVCIYLVSHFWLHWLFLAACGLSLVVMRRGCSWLQCVDFSPRWLLLSQISGSRASRLQSLWHMDSAVVAPRLGAQAQQLWRAGFLAPRHMGSSQTRDQTPMPLALAGGFFTIEPPGKPAPQHLSSSDNVCFTYLLIRCVPFLFKIYVFWCLE